MKRRSSDSERTLTEPVYCKFINFEKIWENLQKMQIFGAFVSKHFCTETILFLSILENKFKIQKCWYQRDLGKLQLVFVFFLEWFLSIWTLLFSRETLFEVLNFFIGNLSAYRFSQNVQNFPKKFIFSTFLTKTNSFDEFTLDINCSTFL